MHIDKLVAQRLSNKSHCCFASNTKDFLMQQKFCGKKLQNLSGEPKEEEEEETEKNNCPRSLWNLFVSTLSPVAQGQQQIDCQQQIA